MSNEAQRFENKWSQNILRRGYTCVPNLIFDEASNLGLTASELMVLFVLIRYRWAKDEEVFPSIQTIAKQAGVTSRTVSRCLARLEANGYIRVDLRRGASSIYDLKPLVEFLDGYYTDADS